MKNKRMQKLSLLMLLAAGLFIMVLSACSVPGIVIKGPDINPQVNPQVNITPPPGVTGDIHFIQPDDYFVYLENLGSRPWDRVWLAKMLAPATPETRNMAHFILVQNGASEWYPLWVRTRPAVSSDLVIGKEIFFFDWMGEDDIHLPPENNQMARAYEWGHSRITDTADAYRGFILAGGEWKVALNNIRVAY